MRAGRDAGYMDLSGHVVEIERPTGLVGCLIEPRDQRMDHWRRVAALPALMQACAAPFVCVCVCGHVRFFKPCGRPPPARVGRQPKEPAQRILITQRRSFQQRVYNL